MIRVLIADDHQVILDGFESIFGRIQDIELVGKLRNGKEVLDFLTASSVDIAILDIKMPLLNGVETCKKISKLYPNTKVIALSMFDQQSYMKRMFQYGAMGYLLKDDTADEVEKAIRLVYDGEKYISAELKDRLTNVDRILNPMDQAIEITSREEEVLSLLSEGMTDNEIGEKLFISFHTAKTHRKKLIAKFGAKNTTELVRMAIEQGRI